MLPKMCLNEVNLQHNVFKHYWTVL